jgi:hypothetical protein
MIMFFLRKSHTEVSTHAAETEHHVLESSMVSLQQAHQQGKDQQEAQQQRWKAVGLLWTHWDTLSVGSKAGDEIPCMSLFSMIQSHIWWTYTITLQRDTYVPQD